MADCLAGQGREPIYRPDHRLQWAADRTETNGDDMRRRTALPVVALLALGSLSACSGSSSTDSAATPSPTPTATTSATTSATASASSPSPSASTPSSAGDGSGSPAAYQPRPTPSNLPTVRIEAASLHSAYLGTNAASGTDEQAAVTAWMAFWQGAADTYYLYKPTAQFTAVAGGTARSEVLRNLAKVKSQNERIVGWAQDNVTSVKISGDTATIRDCTRNFTFSVDKESEPITRVVPFYDVTGTLKKTNGQWTVQSQSSRNLDTSCLG